MTSVALISAAAVCPGLRFISRAELAVMIEVICWPPIEIFTSAMSPLMRTPSMRPVRGPDYRDMDIAFIKHTRLREQLDLEFRAEIFNLTNAPAFGQPNGVLGSSAFGTITSTATDPRVMQFGLKLNY